MKLHAVLLAVCLCLAAHSADAPRQTAPKKDPSEPKQQQISGCLDEQNGHYVLLDNQMAKIVNLHSSGSDQEVFAKHMGHKVQVTGTKSSTEEGTFTVSSIETVAPNCSQSK